jgi:hypothetical protein
MSNYGSDRMIQEADLPSHTLRSWNVNGGSADAMVLVSDDISDQQGLCRRASAERLIEPKLEPLDDDEDCLDELREAPLASVPSNGGVTPPQSVSKRPRGRPRKHPLDSIALMNKVTKGRSKTGCITCRKRKKKCDEAKPRCKPAC